MATVTKEASTAKERVLFKHWLKGHDDGAALWIKYIDRFHADHTPQLHPETRTIDTFLPATPAHEFIQAAFIWAEHGDDDYLYWEGINREWNERLKQFRIQEGGSHE